MRRHLWWVGGLVLVVAGVVLALSTEPDTRDFGWFAYTPHDTRIADYVHHCSSPCVGYDFSHSSDVVLLGPGQLLGDTLALLGLLVLAAGLGYVLGRRRRTA